VNRSKPPPGDSHCRRSRRNNTVWAALRALPIHILEGTIVIMCVERIEMFILQRSRNYSGGVDCCGGGRRREGTSESSPRTLLHAGRNGRGTAREATCESALSPSARFAGCAGRCGWCGAAGSGGPVKRSRLLLSAQPQLLWITNGHPIAPCRRLRT
jgi:hypothetical protein